MMLAVDEPFMREALAEAGRGTLMGEMPFGAVVVDATARILARAHERTVSGHDPSLHAEIEAVRAACRVAGPDLTGCTLYTTTEPCAMCFTAAWLARMSRIVYGCRIEEMKALCEDQRELSLTVETMNAASGEPMELVGGVLASECLAQFRTPFGAAA